MGDLEDHGIAGRLLSSVVVHGFDDSSQRYSEVSTRSMSRVVVQPALLY